MAEGAASPQTRPEPSRGGAAWVPHLVVGAALGAFFVGTAFSDHWRRHVAASPESWSIFLGTQIGVYTVRRRQARRAGSPGGRAAARARNAALGFGLSVFVLLVLGSLVARIDSPYALAAYGVALCLYVAVGGPLLRRWLIARPPG